MSEQNPNQMPPPGQGPSADDAGSQALSDALRSSFFIVKIIMVVLVLAFLSSGFFTVRQDERAIVLRLGKPVGEGEKALLMPGAHWAFPKPIDSIEKIPYNQVQEAQSSVGWMLTPEERRKGATPSQTGNGLDPATTTYDLTSDTNVIHVVADLHYRITDPIHFHFDFSNAPVFVTNDLNNALLYTTSQFSVDDILTRRRTAFKEAVTARMNDLIQEQRLGIRVDQLDVESAPPTYLLAKFNEVDTATQKRNTARTQAESYATTTLAEARGQAATRTNVAEAGRSRLVAMVGAQAREFIDVQPEYERDPQFFKQVRQMMVLEQIYTNAQEKILEPHQNARELRLNLSREPQGSSTNSTTP
ncbi:MAG: protease modulator HflK [Limisphaerales bacterium]